MTISASPDSPRSPLAQDAGGVSIVDDEHGVMLAGEASDLGERRDIAVHGEHALGQDEFRPVISLILTQKRSRDGRRRDGGSGSRAPDAAQPKWMLA